MAIELNKDFSGVSDYVTKHDSNYTVIETNINSLLLAIGGSGSSTAVPAGLAQIFDRDGVIGIGSFQLINQVVAGDSLTIPLGAAYIGGTYRANPAPAVINTISFGTTGTHYIDIDTAGLASMKTTSSANSIYSFTWTHTTDTISAATLLVDVLLDGDDYNDMLTSASTATNFTSVADRLEAIEDALGILGAYYAQDTGTTTGLVFGYKLGVVRNDNVIADTAAGTTTLAATQLNYVELNPSTGAVTDNIVGFTSSLIPLFEVNTNASAITAVTDRRTWASLGGGGGGGGGHAQNTDIGTTSNIFTLNSDEAGTPSENGVLEVERGTSANVNIRYNETTDKWEFTNDGAIYAPLGAPDVGVQELSKFVTLEDPPAVVDLTASSSTSGYVKVDLTSTAPFSGIADGVQGMLLRVQLDDATPSATTVVLIRQLENPSTDPAESMRVFARDSADVDDKEASMILTPGQGVDVSDNVLIGFEYELTASAAFAANLKIFVLGYWEKVTGVGTQDFNFTHTEVVPAVTTNTVNVTGFANRMLIHSVTFTKNAGTATGLSDFTVYRKDTHLAADLEYQLDNISPAAGPPSVVDTLPWMHVDDDDTAELHFKILNNDATNSITWDITIRGERFD